MPGESEIRPYQRTIYGIILAIAILWCMGILIAPLWAGETDIRGGVSNFLYTFYSNSCHQMDERSFHMLGNKLGVCSRCTMIYFGFLLSSILYPFVRKLNNPDLPPLWLLLGGAGLVAVDVGLNLLGWHSSNFATREITGSIIGLILPFFIIPGTIRLFYEFFTQSEIVPKK
jgi:uncharacterized membrane protein